MEDLNKGQGTPSPIPGENPQGKPENADKAELENLKRLVSEQTEKLDKNSKRIEQAEYVIRKQKDKLKEAGIEDEEEKLDSDKVRDIVQDAISREMSKITEPLKTQITELGRSLAARKAVTVESGDGQQHPMDDGTKEPFLSETDRKLVNSFSGKWDPKRKGYITKSGRFIDLNDKSGIANA